MKKIKINKPIPESKFPALSSKLHALVWLAGKS